MRGIPTISKGTLPNLLANTSLFVISLLFCLLLAETFARFRVEAWPFEAELLRLDYLTARDETLRWRFSAGAGRNSLGLTNKEIETRKEPTYRILFLGDSMVFGNPTSSGELYTQVIESELNRKRVLAHRHIEMINAGVPGYTTYQEKEFLRIYGLDMKPDMTILGFVVNDLYKYLHRPTKGYLLSGDPSARLHRFDTRRFPGALFAKSYLAHGVYYKAETLLKKLRKYPYYPFEHGDMSTAWTKHQWEETSRLIGEMNDLLAERNIRFVVVAFPMVNQVNDAYLSLDRNYVLSPQERIETICRTRNIAFVDLWKPIYDNGGPELFRDTIHLNKRGNDIVASEVSRYLAEHLPAWSP